MTMNRKKFFSLLDGMASEDILQVQKAYWLSKNAHRVQKPRDTGERYFEHPREVALLLIEHGYKDKNILTKALLHDVIEDTNTPVQIVVDLFGHNIWQGLSLLSKVIPVFDPVTGEISGRHKKPIEEYYAEISKADPSIQAVKIADRLHNLRSMKAWGREKQVKYAKETQQYILPIAQKADARFAKELFSEVYRVLGNTN